MAKRGYFGPFQWGAISEASQILQFVADKTAQQQSTKLDAVFFSSAFQAGIDQFLTVADPARGPTTHSRFLAARTSHLPEQNWIAFYEMVDNAFSRHLPDGWEEGTTRHDVVRLKSFLIDILYSMSIGASLLWLRIPDVSKIESILSPALYVPISNLFASLEEVKIHSLVQQKTFSLDDVRRYVDVLSSDLFTKYSETQSLLDDSDTSLEVVLPAVSETARHLLARRERWLSLKESGIGVLRITPKIIDTAFGKLPGALAEAAAKVGIDFFEARRRLVIYDLGVPYDAALFGNLMRMITAGQAHILESQKADEETSGKTDTEY